MLKTLELFAGIGGITHGLRGIATPHAFVEWNEEAKNVLRKNHPDVPIFDDVTKFDASDLRDHIDLLTAGWPCTGFSTAGHGAGFSHEASGLFVEVMRIINECHPSLVFLENSHVLAQTKFLSVVIKALDDSGYDARWLSFRSTAVGALHERHRWFCLGHRRGYEPPTIAASDDMYTRFDWKNDEPPKQVESNTPHNQMLIRLAGNSVVPDQVRFAFNMMYSGFGSSDEDPSWREVETATPVSDEKRVSCGYSKDGLMFRSNVKISEREPLNIVLRPNPLPAIHRVKDLDHVVTKPIRKRFWSTPCHTDFRRTSPVVLTKRLLTNLPSQVRFLDESVPGWRLSGAFCMWLMGYRDAYVG